MKKFVFFVYLFYQYGFSQEFNMAKTWGTYFGDENMFYKSSIIDGDGNIYIVGFIRKLEGIPAFQFTNTASHQFNFGGGYGDGFIVKFDSEGFLLWGTYFGGEEYEEIEDIAIDKFNNVYIIGFTNSMVNIATENAYQHILLGNGNAFLAKFNPEGTLIWSTYFGGNGGDYQNPQSNFNGSNSTGIIVSNNDLLYIYQQVKSESLGTINTFQPNRLNANYLLSCFSFNGERIWSTYYGINSSTITGITSTDNQIIISGRTNDCPPNGSFNTYFATPNCHQPFPGGCANSFVSTFSLSGERNWSTYYGGTAPVRLIFKNILYSDNSLYFAGISSGNSTNISSFDSYQPESSGLSNFLVKFDSFGVRDWGTFVGTTPNASGGNSIANVSKDIFGNLYLNGTTRLTQNIATNNAYQESLEGLHDGFIVKFNSIGERIWGTYFGGYSDETKIFTHFYNNSMYLIGSSMSPTTISTLNSFQYEYISNNLDFSILNYGNIFINKFDPMPLDINEKDKTPFTIYPNPNQGNFQILFSESQTTSFDIVIYNSIGKEIVAINNTTQLTINLNSFSRGLHLVKIKTNKGFYTQKIIVN